MRQMTENGRCYLDRRDTAKIGLLAAEWIVLDRFAHELQERAERATKEAADAADRIKATMRTLQGCEEDDWKDFCRFDFDANRLYSALAGNDSIEVVSGLLR